MADISKLVSPTSSDTAPTERKVGNLVVHTAANNPAQNIKILIYGDSGKGKSVLAASASLVPEMSPVLFLNAEGGTLSVSKFYPDIYISRNFLKKLTRQGWTNLLRSSFFAYLSF